jgi:hypothetical protein
LTASKDNPGLAVKRAGIVPFLFCLEIDAAAYVLFTNFR